ncbi:hypothetical protein [Sphingopyxis granuli]|uniref:hypothetical protein n=1 Tax=Sphingopyxis granuli TaxID=267128 RepID=UPI00155EEFC5|nr:hypothetical protein [Sphingopyxis granuli]
MCIANASYSQMDVVRELVSPSGKRKLRLYRRGDGFFGYEEIYEAFDEYVGLYWSPGHRSGVFDTYDAMMAEIEATTPWLRENG